MSVTHDLATRSHADSASASVASFTWSHGGAASGVAAASVWTLDYTGTSHLATAVTYGGVSLDAIAGGLAVDTAGEQCSCQLWFLGASVPQGTQDIVVTRTNNAGLVAAFAATSLASTDCETFGIVLEQENQALTEQAVDDGSPGTDSLRYAATIYGANTLAGLVTGASSTGLVTNDAGTIVSALVRETAGGQGPRSLGWDAISDDVAAVYVAIREIPVVGGGATWPGFVSPFGFS